MNWPQRGFTARSRMASPWIGACLIAMAAPMDLSAADSVIIIVNKANPATSMSSRVLADYYKKKKTHWPNGMLVRFIDQKAGSPIRKTFLERFLRQTPHAIDLFWIGQKLYTGDSAPVQAPSDAMVIQMVASFDGGVGYVSPSSDLAGEDVKPITVKETN